MNNKLAHFTKIEALFCHILPEMKLRASSLIDTNDPLENKWQWIKFVSYTSNTGDPSSIPSELHDEYYNFYSDYSSQLAHHINIACFSSYNHYLFEKMQFSPPHENLKMWSQYGENHNGACIILKKDILLKNIAISSLSLLANDEVIYKNNPNSYPDFLTHNINNWNKENESIESFFHRNICEAIKKNPSIILNKRIDWRDELEERFIFYERDRKYSYFSIEGAIEKIIFGIKTPNEYIDSIQKNHPKIKLSKITISNSNGIETIDI